MATVEVPFYDDNNGTHGAWVVDTVALTCSGINGAVDPTSPPITLSVVFRGQTFSHTFNSGVSGTFNFPRAVPVTLVPAGASKGRDGAGVVLADTYKITGLSSFSVGIV